MNKLTLSIYNSLKNIDQCAAKRDFFTTSEIKAKKVQQQVDAAEPTVSQLAVEYLERYAKPRKRSWATDEKRLKKYVIPAWGNRKAKDITRRDINLLLDKAAQQGRTGVGARVLNLTVFSQELFMHKP